MKLSLASGTLAADGKPLLEGLDPAFSLKGAFLSLTRQLLFLIPLMLILPKFFGIDGILYSGPIADFIAIIATVIMAAFEFKDIRRLEKGGAA